MLEAYAALTLLRPSSQITVLGSSQVQGAKLACNIVSVGGPTWNIVTRDLLTQLKPPWGFTKPTGSPAQMTDLSSGRLSPSLDADGHIIKTYGMIVLAPNPHNPANRVTILAGLSTYGVLASTRVLSTVGGPHLDDDQLTLLHGQYSERLDDSLLQIVTSAAVIEADVVPAKLTDKSLHIKRLPTTK